MFNFSRKDTEFFDLFVENAKYFHLGAVLLDELIKDPNKALERIENSRITELVFTDTIPFPHESKKIRQLSVAAQFAEIIRRVNNNESISSQYTIR